MKTVLVTGGAGFIGSCLTNYLVEKLSYNVVVLDDLSGGFTENINRNVKFYQASINDIDKLETVFKTHNFDYVYHLAAYAAEVSWKLSSHRECMVETKRPLSF